MLTEAFVAGLLVMVFQMGMFSVYAVRMGCIALGAMSFWVHSSKEKVIFHKNCF